MTLEETATQVITQLELITQLATTICRVLEKSVLYEISVGEDTLQFSQEDKQKVIQFYQQKKTELQALVEALP